MKMMFILLMFLSRAFIIPVAALELEIPEVPNYAQQWMPNDPNAFEEGFWELLRNAIVLVKPEIRASAENAVTVLSCALILSIVRCLFQNRRITELTGTAAVSVILLNNSNTLIHLAGETISELSTYGKLILPVMTAASAAKGNTAMSGALYSGTAIFDALLGSLISAVMLPSVYLFLAFAIGYAATSEQLLKRIKDVIKNLVTWSLKILLTLYTTYMSITGVVSGTTDAAALKAARLTISSVVPVVGNILSEASEAVLVSADIMKNSAGIYGIFAILAMFLGPFVKIGGQYLITKLISVVISIFQEENITTLTEDFSAAMGLLLAMTGAECIFLLISVICFMKGG